MKKSALALYDLGRQELAQQGLILVDTKYEFGLIDGQVVLIDEVHTPDSSRFWYAGTTMPGLKLGSPPGNSIRSFSALGYWTKALTQKRAAPSPSLRAFWQNSGSATKKPIRP
jgi:phosphoribosylaminoimidazole-succinocarboxamide synthase